MPAGTTYKLIIDIGLLRDRERGWERGREGKTNAHTLTHSLTHSLTHIPVHTYNSLYSGFRALQGVAIIDR